jgi:Periplasmic protease
MQKLIIERDGKKINVNLKPEKVDFYSAYVNAMKKSARVIREEDDDWSGADAKAASDSMSVMDATAKDASAKVASKEADSKKGAEAKDAPKASSSKQKKKQSKSIGYVHVWCGGSLSHEALDEIMEEKLADTDGLIFDLRDGYGGNGLEDLDRFYRTENAYPIFKTTYRDGKTVNYKYYYDKPVVAIINNGSRSGKELLAFSLKKTGRAKLVGGTTAGAVLGGRLFPINDRASLYLAIFDGTIGGVRLEGAGVSPDVEVLNTDHSQAGADKQYRAALGQLMRMLYPDEGPIQPVAQSVSSNAGGAD